MPCGAAKLRPISGTPRAPASPKDTSVPYNVSKADVDSIADALEEYYNEAWQKGIKGAVDGIARSQMGPVTAALDQARDGFQTLKKGSADKFRVTLKADLKQQLSLYFSNKYDVISDFVSLAEKGLDQLASLMIPVPKGADLLSKGIAAGVNAGASAVIGFGAKKAQDVLADKAIGQADKFLAAKSSTDLDKMFSNERDAAKFVENTMAQYKTITNYINTLPATITSFDDAITFPKSVFKVQAAASSLSVSLWSLRQYVEAMAARMESCKGVSAAYIKDVRTKMPEVVSKVLSKAYDDGFNKGKTDVNAKKYAAAPEPKLGTKQGGGATQLANRMAHALAQGYYDAGNTGPKIAARPAQPGMRP
jgi:hypothetical protein